MLCNKANVNILFLVLLLITRLEATGQELIPFSLNGKYGYIDDCFNVVITPKYERVENFSDSGYAAARVMSNQWEVLNRSGKVCLRINEGFVKYIYDDAFSYDTRKGCVIIRIKSGKIIKNDLGAIAGSTDGIIAVAFMDDFPGNGYIDLDGHRVLPELRLRRPSYMFSDGLAIVTLENWETAIIDKTGNIVGSLDISYIGQHYSEGLVPVKTKDGSTGYLNKKGEFEFFVPIAISDFLQATSFKDGYAIIMIKENPNSWRIINNKGEYLSKEIVIDSAADFSCGLSLVGEIDKKRKVLKWGYLKTDGEFLIEPILDVADTFYDGFARVVLNGREGLLNSEGKIFWSDEIVSGKYKQEATGN